MPNNMILLETIALTQSAASVTFDNLPTSGYTDLKIVVSAATNGGSGSDQTLIKFNGSTTGYSARLLGGTGSAASSVTIANYAMPNNTTGQTANTFNNGEIYIPNYRGSNNKSYSADGAQENNATAAYMWMTAGLWADSSAITSIQLYTSADSYIAGSTFSLYGIAALGTTPVTAPKATGGNIVANDGTYWYHAFTSSGNFVPQVGLTADVLVIAGGGGGGGVYGNQGAGGGGAGGIFYATSQALTIQNYAATIGAGGAGGVGGQLGGGAFINPGTSGANSTFGSLTAAVGGGGGGGNSAGLNGGSGGGGINFSTAGGTSTQTGTGGTGYGNAGGTGQPSVNQFGGSGGGAGAAGTGGGAGGIGLNTWSSWATATTTGASGYFAGGGGTANSVGGATAGGLGGGGAAASSTTGVNATPGIASTGGGGGGLYNNSTGANATGGNGGSGIILIRYPIN